MSAEDAREDVIENDPVSGVDDTSVDEKTWGWLVLQSSTTGCMFKGRPLISFSNCALRSAVSGGTHSEPCAITTRGSVSVRKLQPGTKSMASEINMAAVTTANAPLVVFPKLSKLERTCRQKL